MEKNIKSILQLLEIIEDTQMGQLNGGFASVASTMVSPTGTTAATNNCHSGNCLSNNCVGGNCVAGCAGKPG